MTHQNKALSTPWIRLKCFRPHSNYISLRRPAGFLQVAVSKAPLPIAAKEQFSVSRGRSRYSPKTYQGQSTKP